MKTRFRSDFCQADTSWLGPSLSAWLKLSHSVRVGRPQQGFIAGCEIREIDPRVAHAGVSLFMHE